MFKHWLTAGKEWSMIIIISMMMTACSHDEQLQTDTSPRAPLQLNVSMADDSGDETRALKSEFVNDDKIGISLIGADGSTDVYNHWGLFYRYYSSVWSPGSATYYTQNSGTYTDAPNVDILTYAPAKVSAYYPYSMGLDPRALTCSGTSQIDWLYAPFSDYDGVNKPYVSYANPIANLEMRHAYALICLQLTCDRNDYGYLSYVTIDGDMGLNATFNSTTGQFSNVERAEAFGKKAPGTNPTTENGPQPLTWMVIPYTTSPITITITAKIRNSIVSATVPNVVVRSGYKVNIPVLIKVENITTEMIINNVTITPWTTSSQAGKDTTPVNNR
jgi:hypothetical protein